MEINDVTGAIIGAAISVHRQLGPGLLESAYNACLTYELQERGCMVEREKALPVRYAGRVLDCGYRLDMVVNDAVIVEVKAVEQIHAVHMAQLLTYLKLSSCDYGLLINFNVLLLKDGVRRLTTRSSSVRPANSVVE